MPGMYTNLVIKYKKGFKAIERAITGRRLCNTQPAIDAARIIFKEIDELYHSDFFHHWPYKIGIAKRTDPALNCLLQTEVIQAEERLAQIMEKEAERLENFAGQLELYVGALQR